MYENCDNHEPSIRTKYLYDAEGRVCAVTNTPVWGYSTMTGYIYNAEGARVAKGTITSMSCDPTANGFQLTESYVLGPGGEELSMLDGSSNWQRTNVYAAGKLIGTYDLVTCTGSGGAEGTCTPNTQVPALHFHIEDPLGTRRLQVSGNVTVLGLSETDIESLPYGNQLNTYPDHYAPSTSNDSTPLHFTGKERDTESGNDYFEARYYSSAMGRFLSPDWSAKQDPVPYAIFDDPQSLNLYSYVRNNPLSRVDADGHCDANGQNCSLWDHFAGAVGGALNIIPATVNLPIAAFNAVSGHFNGPQIDEVPMIQPDAHASQTGMNIGTAATVAYPVAATLADAKVATMVVGEVRTAAAGEAAANVPESIPAGPGARPSPTQQTAINEMGDAHGCSTCGTRTPGTQTGNWVGDHQPPTKLNPTGGPQVYKPQCLQCSRQQGGQVAAAVKAAKKQIPQ